MASNRPTKETIYVRRNFTVEERLEMASDLAQAHNRMAAISEDEATMKAQIKERKTAVEQTIGSLSRKLNDGFDMANVPCDLKWDTPNVGEVSYIGPDGKVEKTRAMSIAERQEELNFDESTSVPAEVPDAQAEAVVEQSAVAVDGFFKKNVEDAAAEAPEVTEAVAEEEPPTTNVAPDNF